MNKFAKKIAAGVRNRDSWWFAAAAMIGAGVVAFVVISGIKAPSDNSLQGDYAAALAYVVTKASISLGLWLAGAAFLGAVMRAAAHKRRGIERPLMDFIGKLFAVFAASLALWIAMLAVPDLSNTLARLQILLIGALLILLGSAIAVGVARADADDEQQSLAH